MTTKTIIVPNRDRAGWLHGTKQITVEWKCPTCNADMGVPYIKQFCEDGEFYPVSVWENECGHIAKYKDLKQVETSKQ